MTPAVNIIKKRKISYKLHEYVHDAGFSSYGEEAAEKLGVEKDRVFKTLIVSDENKKLYVAILPVSFKLDLKLYAKAIGIKKVIMADKKIVEKATGYVLGGVSPIGQKRKLETIIHRTAEEFDSIFVSAGRRGLQVELKPEDLLKLTSAKCGIICEE